MIEIRPLGPDYYHFRCLTFGPLGPDEAATLPEDAPQQAWFRSMRREGRFFDAHRLLRNLCRTYGAAGMLAWEDARVVGQLRFYPQAVLDLAGGPGVCLQDKHTTETVRRLSDSTLPSPESMSRRTLRISCIQVAHDYRQRGIARSLVEQTVNWAASGGWHSIEARGIKAIGPLLDQLPMAPAKVFTDCGFRVDTSYHDPVVQQRIEKIRDGRCGEAAMEELSQLPDEMLCHADMVYELTRALG